MGSHVALVKGNLHMGFQVDRATTFFDFDKGGRQIGSQVNEKKKKNRVRFLDEVDIEQFKQTERQVFLYKAYYAKHLSIFAS